MSNGAILVLMNTFCVVIGILLAGRESSVYYVLFNVVSAMVTIQISYILTLIAMRW